MQVITKFIFIFIFSILTHLVFARPPVQVLRTCVDNTAYDKTVNIIRLSLAGALAKSSPDCEYQYDVYYKGHVFSTTYCQDKFYFILDGKKIDPETAENGSVNPEIKPGVEFTSRAIWSKINYEDVDYLCIEAPLAEQGIGASHIQYYLIENAFDKSQQPLLYYYFFDKNIAPITSDTF